MKLLSLDGGGVFGIGQASILSAVDCSKFEIFAGTSIGSVIAALLALDPDNNKKLVNLFKNDIPTIFKYSMFKKYNLFPPRYDDKELNKMLRKYFGNTLLKNVKKPLFVVTINATDQKLKVWSSLDPKDGNTLLWEVIRCAVAAETYFNPYKIMDKEYADGGIIANNPSMVGVAAASKILGVSLDDLEVCSIGTGSSFVERTPLTSNKTVFGIAFWVFKILMAGAANSMSDYFCNSLPLQKYVRIEFDRYRGWEMDNPVDMYNALKVWWPIIEKGIKIVNIF